MNNDTKKLQEAIDVCRAGHDDHLSSDLAPLADQLQQDAALRQRYEASQRFDAAVCSHLDEVEIPSDLQQRLLVAMEGQQITLPSRSSRRRWMRIVGGLVTAAALVLVFFALRTQPTQSTDEFLTQVMGAVENPQLSPEPSKNFLKRFPLPQQLLSAAPPRNGAPIKINNRIGVAYTWPKSTALLVVLPKTSLDVGAKLPRNPRAITGGWWVGISQDTKFVYVLMAKDPGEYEACLPVPEGVARATGLLDPAIASSV